MPTHVHQLWKSNWVEMLTSFCDSLYLFICKINRRSKHLRANNQMYLHVPMAMTSLTLLYTCTTGVCTCMAHDSRLNTHECIITREYYQHTCTYTCTCTVMHIYTRVSMVSQYYFFHERSTQYNCTGKMSTLHNRIRKHLHVQEWQFMYITVRTTLEGGSIAKWVLDDPLPHSTVRGLYNSLPLTLTCYETVVTCNSLL